jgi:hypothetical protein
MPPPMPFPTQQGQVTPRQPNPQKQQFTPLENQDPYCLPSRQPAYQQPANVPEYDVTPETEVVVEEATEKAPMFVKDEVVEYEDIADKVVEAPGDKENTVDLESASVVGFDDEEKSKKPDDAVFKDDNEILFERKEKSIWKPPDAD